VIYKLSIFNLKKISKKDIYALIVDEPKYVDDLVANQVYISIKLS